MNINDSFEEEECTKTIIDTLFPYLFMVCFLLGIFISRIKNFLGLRRNLLDETNKNLIEKEKIF